MNNLRTYSKYKSSAYVALKPDAEGYINYSDTENHTWQFLYNRQIHLIQTHACMEFLMGIDELKLASDRVPQLAEVNQSLEHATGWGVTAVPALISLKEFFKLLANKKFPAATFIRRPEEIDYLQEPDIFHELFGHCPMLTNRHYADFTEHYGKMAMQATSEQQRLLARLYWFTVEFGLIQTARGPLPYGGGILSSNSETIYAVESNLPQRKPFDLMTVLRTPYRIDQLQTIYFVINSLEDLYQLLSLDLLSLCDMAQDLGDFPPSFPTDDLV